MKADPRELIWAHYATLVDNRTGKARPADFAGFLGIPVVGGLVCGLVVGVELPPAVCAGLVTVMGFLSAFFFGVMLQVAERAWEWADTDPQQGQRTSRHARFLGEVQANAGYASLVSIVAAAMFVAAGVVHKS